MPRCWTIAEYEGFYAERPELSAATKQGFQALPRTHFEALKELLNARTDTVGDGATPQTALFSLSHDRRLGDVVKACSHVGVVAFADGSQIEILPKLARKVQERSPTENERLRGILLRMLREAFDIDPAVRGPTDLRLARLPLLEAFYRMFLEALERLVKRGLPGGYVRVEENERFFKGKLMVAEHLRQNLVRRERFWVAHDVFRTDTPANRLLRTGLDFVRAHAVSEGNRRVAGRLAAAFEEIPPSCNLAADFGACAAAERDGLQREALRWCDVFLRGHGLANLPGTRKARAFLFPMETVFERAVVRLLRRHAPEGVEVSAQEKRLFLFEEAPQNGGAFRLKPDIVIRRGKDVLAVADTKWKLLADEPGRNYEMAQADMYQMYAYQKRYGTPRALLLYPGHGTLGKLAGTPPVFRTEGDAEVQVQFWQMDGPKGPEQSAERVFAAAMGTLDLPAETRAALAEARTLEAAPNARRYDDIDGLMAELREEPQG